MDKREKKRVAYSVYSRVKKRSKASVTSKWDDTIMLIVESRPMKKQLDAISMLSNFVSQGETYLQYRRYWTPSWAILRSSFSRIYIVYLFFHCDGLYETTGKERSSFFPKFINIINVLDSLYLSNHFKKFACVKNGHDTASWKKACNLSEIHGRKVIRNFLEWMCGKKKKKNKNSASKWKIAAYRRDRHRATTK